MMTNLKAGDVISFTYKNYKGVTSKRLAVYRSTQYGSSEYHNDMQMFLGCFCTERLSYRSFAIVDISDLKVLG